MVTAGVDVASGVADDGGVVKDHGKIDAFVRELDDDGLFESDDVAEEDVDDFCALHGAEPK